MKQLILIACSIFAFNYFLSAQDCNGRYLEPIATSVDIQTLTYSDITGYEMDVYTPAGDTEVNRPLIVMAHGGSFIGGSKQTATMVHLCTEFAKLGYVTASIQYSLTNILNLSDSLNMTVAVMDAVADGKAAIRWFRKDAIDGENQFNIDPEQVFVLGNSAGAILMSHLTYVAESDELVEFIEEAVNVNGGFEGDAGNDGYSSKVNAFVNCAGGIYNVDYIDEDEPPLISFHGDADGVVPFDCNNVFWEDFGDALINLCGSYPIRQHAENIGLRNEILVFPGANHVPWEEQNFAMDTIFSRAVNFLYPELACNQNIVGLNEVSDPEIKLYPNPAKDGFFVSLSNFNKTEGLIINLNNVLGNTMKTVQVFENQVFINRGELPSGLYLLTIDGKCAKKYKIILE